MTQLNSYSLTIADQNIIHSLDYEVSIVATCPGGGSIDYTVCAPVLGGAYPTACVFNGNPAGIGQGIYFGIDGCGCRQTDNQGFSTCWDGSQASTEDLNNGVQECGPYCPLPPSDSRSTSHSSSISLSRSFTSSRSWSSSVTPTVSVSSSPSQSTVSSQSGSRSGLLGLPRGVGIGIIGGAVALVGGLLGVALWYYCRKPKGSTQTQNKRRQQRDDDVGVLLQRGAGGSLNDSGADYAASLLDGAG